MLRKLTIGPLDLAVGLAALLAIASQMAGLDPVHWGAKPLTTLLILLIALRGVPLAGAVYRRWIALGLVFGLAGDIFLMLPGDWFLFGLVAFLLNHLAYLRALTRDAPLLARPEAVALFALAGLGMLAALWPGLPAGMGAPVVVYAAVLAAMAAQAAIRATVQGTDPARWAALGGVLFMASDAVLAINRFRFDVPLSSILVLGSYFAAQWLFARSAAAQR